MPCLTPRERSVRAVAVGFIAALFVGIGIGHAQPSSPHVGYVYPAGGRQGATFQIQLGGQFLAGATNIFVSGDGIQAAVLEYNRPLTQKEFTDLRTRLIELRNKRRDATQAARDSGRAGGANATNVWTSSDERELEQIRNRILKNPPNRQGNPAIAETVLARVTVAATAEPGDHEIRLGTANGLSNPLIFCVGELPESSKPAAKVLPELNILRELNPGSQPQTTTPKSDLRVTLPATVNGQIMPGEIDRIRFTARKGQQLVIVASARELIPYLADAVPGWFQATLTLHDSKGAQLAYDDRYRFHPDPVIHFEIPKDGEYSVDITDSLYRGREDFVYRVTLGELPFVTDVFPLGGMAGTSTTVELKGWNLTATNWVEDNTTNPPGMRWIRPTQERLASAPLPFAVDTLPECLEQEPNNSIATAQPVRLPVIVNGRIDEPGDRDVFRFDGRRGQEFVAEVYARRLNSPLDSVLRLMDSAGRQVAFNDDFEDKASGLNTHHADSYLRVMLPADGVYYVQIGDAQQKGGSEYAYRLRLGPPVPDFQLRMVPSSLAVRGGMTLPLTAYALRKDGFTNAIDLRLSGGPPGARLTGARIPPGQDQVRFTLSIPMDVQREPFRLALEGVAVADGRDILRPVVPAEDMMQAFAYRHLVPSRELKVMVTERGMPRPMVRILENGPVKIPAGGTARVRLGTPSSAFSNRFKLELSEPPDGIAIQSVAASESGETEMVLKSDPAKVKAGLEGNLIVNLFPIRIPQAGQPAGGQGNRQRQPVGTLPAIPFKVVAE